MKRPVKHAHNELWDSIRVYLPRSRAAHLIPPDASPNSCEPALCGLTPSGPFAWYGTGSQDEHDTAAALPSCITCQRIRRNHQ